MSSSHFAGLTGPDRAAVLQRIAAWSVFVLSAALLATRLGLDGDAVRGAAPATLACALLSSACLLALNHNVPGRVVFVRVSAIAIAMSSAYLLFGTVRWAEGALLGNRMSGGAAIEFLVFSGALLALTDRARRGHRLAFVLATIGGVASVLPLLAYLLDPRGTWGIDVLTAVAPLSAGVLLLLYSALLLGFPGEGWVRVLLSDGVGGSTARRYLPLAVLLPLLLAYAGLNLTNEGMRFSGVHLGAVVVILVMAGVATILWTAAAENAREEISQHENLQLRAILDSIDTSAVLVLDPAGRVAMRNQLARDMFSGSGQEATSLLDETFFRLSDRQPLAPEDNPVHRLLGADETEDLLIGWTAPNGAERALNFSSVRLPAIDPGRAQLMLTIEDQTENWLLRTSLSKDQRSEGVGQLIWGVAHEMANIFGIVQISAESARLEAQSAKTGQNLEAIFQACRRGRDLTHKLLDMTRGAGSKPEDVDVTEVLKTASDLASRVMPSFVAFEVSLPKAPCIIRCVRTDLESAALNLLANARNAIADGARGHGRIALRAQVLDGIIVIEVTDDGPGIPDDLMDRVREPYFTTREAKGGRGIGLTLVDTLARQAGGTFELLPNAPQGTRAVLRLPQTEAQPAAPQPSPETDGIDLSGYRLLVAETDPLFRNILSDGLRATGAAVTTVTSGRAASDQLADAPAPDVLITNLRLSDGVDGIDLAQTLAKSSPPSRVIFLSGAADFGARQNAEQLGLVLGKPVPLADLADAISLLSPISPQ